MPTSGNVSGAAKMPLVSSKKKKYTCSAGQHVAEARVWASNLDLRAEIVRAKVVSLSRPKRLSVSTSTRPQISGSSPTMLWNL